MRTGISASVTADDHARLEAITVDHPPLPRVASAPSNDKEFVEKSALGRQALESVH